jgi:hypothetical protein
MILNYLKWKKVTESVSNNKKVYFSISEQKLDIGIPGDKLFDKFLEDIQEIFPNSKLDGNKLIIFQEKFKDLEGNSLPLEISASDFPHLYAYRHSSEEKSALKILIEWFKGHSKETLDITKDKNGSRVHSFILMDEFYDYSRNKFIEKVTSDIYNTHCKSFFDDLESEIESIMISNASGLSFANPKEMIDELFKKYREIMAVSSILDDFKNSDFVLLQVDLDNISNSIKQKLDRVLIDYSSASEGELYEAASELLGILNTLMFEFRKFGEDAQTEAINYAHDIIEHIDKYPKLKDKMFELKSK